MHIFAMKPEEALGWHDATKEVAGVAERAGFHIRAMNRRWQVWATDGDFADLAKQADGP
jgi:hypothetical protein